MKDKTEKARRSERFMIHRDRRIREIRERRKNHKKMEIGAPGKNEENK